MDNRGHGDKCGETQVDNVIDFCSYKERKRIEQKVRKKFPSLLLPCWTLYGIGIQLVDEDSNVS